jgi:hypothetical protein
LKVLLGDPWLSRLTIAVTAKKSGADIDAGSIRSLQEPTSPFYTVHAGGAKIIGLSSKPESFRDLLFDYISLPSQLTQVQEQLLSGQITHLDGHIESALKRMPSRAVPRRASISHRSTNRVTGRSLKESLTEATDRSHHLEVALAESEIEVKRLREELEQTRSEYASLRSELQLNDNMEQNKIVRSLGGLNRGIENFGRCMAEHLVDNHISSYSNDDTALKAFDLNEIKAQFHHSEGIPSLVVSSSGAGMPTEDFFDLAVRSILCKRLCENIFLPFHPTLAKDSSNGFMTDLYQVVRCQGE